MNRKQCWAKLLKFSLSISMALPFAIHAQEEDGEIYDLSPFSVEASDNEGYMAQTTLAGSRVRSDIRDLGSSISIVTKDFMEDTAGTDAQSLLYLVGNVEVGGVLGNYANVDTFDSSTQESRLTPQRGQRIRGLVSANLTRDYFQSDIAFDAYNTSRVTVNRGPNSILFGLGSPGGVINNTTNKAVLGEEFGELSIRVDNNNGHRETLDFNKTLIKDRLAIRVNLLNQNQRFRQEEAFSDDTRFFIAWNAVLLKNEGSDVFGATRFRGSYENGEIYSNPPDVVPPVDRFSSWWNGVGTQEDANRLLSVPGVTLSEIGDGSISNAQVLSAISSGLVTVPAGMTAEEYAAIEGRFVPQTTVHTFKRSDPNDPSWGGEKNVSWRDMYYLYPALNVDSVTSQERGYNDPALAGIQGIFGRWRPFVGGDINRNVTQDVIWTNSLYEQKTSTLGGAGFTETSLNDRNVFDYHKHLFSGTTNFIEKDFDIKQFFLEQELFGGKAGFEIAWDDQSSEQTDRNPLDRLHFKAIHIDISEFERPGNEDFTAGLIANENVGRPVVLLDDDNLNRRTDDQETFRATIFGTLNFNDFIDGKAGKILGSHTLTGLFEDRTNEFWSKSTRGAWWADNSKWPGSNDISSGLSDNFRRRIKSKIYLGPDVRGLSSPGEVRIDTGLNVPFHEIGDEYGIWYYDNNAEVESGQKETWRIIEHVNTANIGRSELESKAFSLQSRILSDHLVGMYAVRNDKQTVYQRLQETVNYGDPSIPGVRPLRIDLPGIHEIDGNFNEGLLFLEDTPASTAEDDTTTWSIVGKYPEVLLGDLPFGMDITAHYYEAESFQPAGISNNVLNQPLASPFGETEEYGVTIELFDRRLSIRYNEYTTANSNSRTGNFNGHLGNITGWFNARFLDRITSSDNTGAPLFPNVTDALLTPDTIPNNSARKSGTDADLGGFTSYQEYYDAIIAAIVPRAQEARNVRVETLENGDRVDLIDPIRGLNSTQDFVSEGKEIDIIGQLTDNLSISLNVAQQETVTTNTAPVAIPLAFEQAELLQRPLPNSPGGWSLWDLRDEAFQGTLTTIGDTYARTVREMRVAQGKDGTVSQEQREWRVNLAMRYDFLEGAFKGLQVGGNLRYQDEVAAGYPNKFDEFGNALPDIENPFFGPSELNGDLFIRYGRSLTDKIDWKIQLNMRNLYRDRGSKDIPVTYNPDGQVAIIRIPNEQQFLLTNTVSF